jgi:2-amino-4-hydroxy-6-hydroxymethyldihydropteridine diphosphokinase
MSKVYLSLGSNIGDRLAYIKNALKEIKHLKNTKVLKSSSIYQTEPWGYKKQESFLNLIISIETGKSPLNLIEDLKEIEYRCGRQLRDKWLEREIDIDILFFEDYILKSEQLEIPHPQIQDRRFVLVPLNEIEPGLIHPVFNKSVKELLEITKDKSKVIKHKDKI